MYINLESLFLYVFAIAAIIGIVYFIIVLNKLINLINNINRLLDRNINNIDIFCDTLSTISKNAIDISKNVKDISEVATEVTAEAIVAKESLINNYETIKDILNIILSIFIKK